MIFQIRNCEKYKVLQFLRLKKELEMVLSFVVKKNKKVPLQTNIENGLFLFLNYVT